MNGVCGGGEYREGERKGEGDWGEREKEGGRGGGQDDRGQDNISVISSTRSKCR